MVTETTYPMPAHAAVLKNAAGEVLLVRRAMPGPWTLPGADFEGGQDWLGSLSRMLGRLGVEASPGRLTGIYSEGAPAGRLVACFRIERHQGSPRTGSEILDMGWFSVTKLPEGLPKAEARMIQDGISFGGEVFVR